MINVNSNFDNEKPQERINIIHPAGGNFDDHSYWWHRKAESLCPGFELDNNNIQVITLLILYFAGAEQFLKKYTDVTGDFADHNKGICLYGPLGSGKSLIFTVFKFYTKYGLRMNSFTYLNETDLYYKIQSGGLQAAEEFYFNYGNPKTVYIDDFASNIDMSKVNHYGNEINVLETFIKNRYIIYQKYNRLTHISTNKTPKEMKELFDERIIDRMKEMFNNVPLKGSSRRKGNNVDTTKINKSQDFEDVKHELVKKDRTWNADKSEVIKAIQWKVENVKASDWSKYPLRQVYETEIYKQ
jgi:hypothetical protein